VPVSRSRPRRRQHGYASVSATRRILNTGFLASSSNSICHSAFCFRLREMLPTRLPQTLVISAQASGQSVELRSSEAPSDFAGSGLVSDLTGSILLLSTCGVSTRAETSTEPVRSGARSERG